VRRVLAAALTFALALPALAAGAELKDLDLTGLPTVRATYVADAASPLQPVVKENGRVVAGLKATNLGRSKSVLLVIDRSRSMDGQPLADAVAAARTFIAAKPPEDRIAVATVATEPVLLTNFSTATIDADTALRSIQVDAVEGTKLYDSVVLAANTLAAEPLPSRVVIVVTDGNETRSEASLNEAIIAAQDAGSAVYVVAIESSKFNPEPLRELAGETGGTYYGAASSEALAGVYSSIAEELQRTWQFEYLTRSRAGDDLVLEVGLPGGTLVQKRTRIPGESLAVPQPESNPLLPEVFYDSEWGGMLLAGVVGVLVLLAVALAFAAPKGTWLRGRLEPHVGETRRAIKAPREGRRFALFAGVFHATERLFGNLRPFRRVATTLQRADLPLRAGEFIYVMGGSGLLAGLFASVLRPPLFVVVGAVCLGGLIPYFFVALKARKRLRAFEDQLPDILITMAASLKAGHSFRQGIQTVVDEGVDPAAKEFKRVLTETRLGRPMDDALNEMAERVGSSNFEFVMSAVTIQRQVGGSLAGLFDMVADTVRQRQQFQRKIKGLTAMGRMSAYTLIGLPFVVGAAITLINREYMEPLFSTSTGHKLFILMAVMMTIGSLILKKIVSFKG
jgi:tight adherence protein B